MSPNPSRPNRRRKRYARWVERVVKYLNESGEVRTANWLLSHLPQDRFTPPSANSASQKLTKEPDLRHREGWAHDVRGHSYRTLEFYHIDYERGYLA